MGGASGGGPKSEELAALHELVTGLTLLLCAVKCFILISN